MDHISQERSRDDECGDINLSHTAITNNKLTIWIARNDEDDILIKQLMLYHRRTEMMMTTKATLNSIAFEWRMHVHSIFSQQLT